MSICLSIFCLSFCRSIWNQNPSVSRNHLISLRISAYLSHDAMLSSHHATQPPWPFPLPLSASQNEPLSLSESSHMFENLGHSANPSCQYPPPSEPLSIITISHNAYQPSCQSAIRSAIRFKNSPPKRFTLFTTFKHFGLFFLRRDILINLILEFNHVSYRINYHQIYRNNLLSYPKLSRFRKSKSCGVGAFGLEHQHQHF